MVRLRLLNDSALGEGNDPSLDGLGFATYARVLARAAIGTPGPFTVGVFGEWGTGKTSLMRLVERELKGDKNVVTVWFNAWRYEKEEHPIVPLVATLIRTLERRRGLLRDLGDRGKSLLRALRAVAYGFSARSKVKVPGFAEIEASFVAKDMIERSQKLTPDPLLDRSLYYEAFELLSMAELPKSKRIVVLVDDLDRCFPEAAIHLLESIKLVLAQPGFVFVIGVARTVLEGYLEHKYAENFGITNFKGQTYLDKIVQMPFHIPSHGGRIEQFSDQILRRIPREAREEFKVVLPIVASASGSNPRSTIRFVNNLLVDVAISRELSGSGAMERVGLSHFAVTRCLQLRWPTVFLKLMSSEDICKTISGWTNEDLQGQSEREGSPEAAVARQMMIEKDLLDLLFSDQGRAWLADPTARTTTVEFLQTQRHEPLSSDKKEPGKGRARSIPEFLLFVSAEDSHEVLDAFFDELAVAIVKQRDAGYSVPLPYAKKVYIDDFQPQQLFAMMAEPPVLIYVGPNLLKSPLLSRIGSFVRDARALRYRVDLLIALGPDLSVTALPPTLAVFPLVRVPRTGHDSTALIVADWLADRAH